MHDHANYITTTRKMLQKHPFKKWGKKRSAGDEGNRWRQKRSE